MTTVYLLVTPAGRTMAGTLDRDAAEAMKAKLGGHLVTVELAGAQALMASSLLGGDL